MEVDLPGHEDDCASSRSNRRVTPQPCRERRPKAEVGPPGGDTGAYLNSQLDEIHVAVRAARRQRASDDAPGLIEAEDSETFVELVDLAKAWIQWLVDAAHGGDPAARAQLRDLGFDGPLTRGDDSPG